ncbi:MULTISPECIES: ribonuclease III [unclassified Corynebacterium]|uniref:ribonuclease III n=1 Tax=unclassified Corynebacterium TaxID=2624378 RepID=UPI003526A99F
MSARKQRPTGMVALTKAFDSIEHAPLLASFGVELPTDLLRLALTHRSFANENGHLPNNERLEFLGDSVLGLSVAARLYQLHPTRSESDISKMRASIVSRYGLAEVARDIGLGRYILLGKGETSSGGSDKDSILADTTEALLGAIYLEHGFEVARAVVLRLFSHLIETAAATGMHNDWKTSLQERLAERKLPMPEYSVTSEGPDHDRQFTATVTVAGRELGTGRGTSKKTAEQDAAAVAYDRLRDELDFGPDSAETIARDIASGRKRS